MRVRLGVPAGSTLGRGRASRAQLRPLLQGRSAAQRWPLSACVALRESEEDAVAAPFLLPATTPQSAQSTSSIDKALAEALHGAGGEMKRSALNKVWQALEGPGELKAHLQSRPRFFTVSARLVKLTSQGVQLLQSQPPERQPLSSSCSGQDCFAAPAPVCTSRSSPQHPSFAVWYRASEKS